MTGDRSEPVLLLPVTCHPSPVTPFQFFDLFAQLLDAREEFLVAALVARGRSAFDEEGAAGFEHAGLHVVEAREALAVRDRLEFALGQKLARQSVFANLAVLDERRRGAFGNLVR